MRILLTAFEPFDETGLNASLEGCRYFLERWADDFDLRFLVLPVEYGPDTEAVTAALAERPADVLLHTGQAAGSEEIRVERIAVNVRYAGERGPEGRRPQCPIEPEGPVALLATLPVEPVAEAIREVDVPAWISNHAGVYLCNHVLYQSLLREQRQPTGAQVGFLHVPLLLEQAAAMAHPGRSALPSMTAEQIGLAVWATLRCLARQQKV